MTNSGTVAFENSEISWPRSLRFWLLLIFDIPSIICSLFVLYHLLINRTSRSALHNHTVIILLTIALLFQLTDIPWYLDFIRHGFVRPQIPARCLLWWLVDLGFYNTAALILAWTSIERHILVFHDRWISTRKKRFFVHYLPLCILILYSTIYYTTVIFFPPCQHKFVYTLPVCAASPCHLFHRILGLWEMGVHGCLSTIIVAFSSIALLVRVIVHKRRRNRVFRWKNISKNDYSIVINICTIFIIKFSDYASVRCTSLWFTTGYWCSRTTDYLFPHLLGDVSFTFCSIIFIAWVTK